MKKLLTLSICVIAAAVIAGVAIVAPLAAGAKETTPASQVAPQQGKRPTSSEVAPHPEDWITVADDKRGYAFDVPAGTEGEVTKDGYLGKAPTKVFIRVSAFKDPKITKTGLLNFALDLLKIGNLNVGLSSLIDLSEDCTLAEYFGVTQGGTPFKGKVLVALDKTDNYVMLVATEEKDLRANGEIIDRIWGSFKMKSGGASGKTRPNFQ